MNGAWCKLKIHGAFAQRYHAQITPKDTIKIHKIPGQQQIYAVQSGNHFLAEGEGFEPSVPLRAQRFSRPPRSTTPAPLRYPIHGRKIAGNLDFRRSNQQGMEASVPCRGDAGNAIRFTDTLASPWSTYCDPGFPGDFSYRSGCPPERSEYAPLRP